MTWPQTASAKIAIFALLIVQLSLPVWSPVAESLGEPPSSLAKGSLRVATWNVSLFRDRPGALVSELESGKSKQAHRVAEVLCRIRPDIVLLNEFDDDAKGRGAELFQRLYLSLPNDGLKPLLYRFRYRAPVNTGLPSGMDLNRDGDAEDPEDAYGFGRFPGQYGMLVLSRFPIDHNRVRTFQRFLWSRMPRAQAPVRADGTPYYPDPIWRRLRLSSKSFWDIPVRVGSTDVHLLASHPTPPVFDGPEDRNGKRNHDEIRMLADYVTPGTGRYFVDDRGQAGGLKPKSHFVIVGDLNADPYDGDSSGNPIRLLRKAPRVRGDLVPTSEGAKEDADRKGGVNEQHRGPSNADTASFSPKSVGNLRLDYVLPSRSLKAIATGVFWPTKKNAFSELLKASDHRMVWVDLKRPVKP